MPVQTNQLTALPTYRRWEGITFDADNGYIYTAMTEIRGGMEDNLNQGKSNNGTNDNGARAAGYVCVCVCLATAEAASAAASQQPADKS